MSKLIPFVVSLLLLPTGLHAWSLSDFDPTNKNSAVRQGMRNIDPTNPNGSVGDAVTATITVCNETQFDWIMIKLDGNLKKVYQGCNQRWHVYGKARLEYLADPKNGTFLGRYVGDGTYTLRDDGYGFVSLE